MPSASTSSAAVTKASTSTSRATIPSSATEIHAGEAPRPTESNHPDRYHQQFLNHCMQNPITRWRRRLKRKQWKSLHWHLPRKRRPQARSNMGIAPAPAQQDRHQRLRVREISAPNLQYLANDLHHSASVSRTPFLGYSETAAMPLHEHGRACGITSSLSDCFLDLCLGQTCFRCCRT
jgi:hypothetical protein